MSIDNGWNRSDKAHEDDYEDGIERAYAIGKLAEEYEKKLLAGKPIMVDGVQWESEEMVAYCGAEPAILFNALLTGNQTDLDGIANNVREFIGRLAEEHIDNMEPDYD